MNIKQMTAAVLLVISVALNTLPSLATEAPKPNTTIANLKCRFVKCNPPGSLTGNAQTPVNL